MGRCTQIVRAAVTVDAQFHSAGTRTGLQRESRIWGGKRASEPMRTVARRAPSSSSAKLVRSPETVPGGCKIIGIHNLDVLKEDPFVLLLAVFDR